MKIEFSFKEAVVGLMLLGSIEALAIGDDVLGRLGTVEPSAGEVKQMLTGMNARTRMLLVASQECLGRFINGELIREEMAFEARAKGWDKRPEVREALERARDEVIISYYLSSFLQPDGSYPSEDEVNTFYQANRTRFLAPRQFHLAQIYLSAPTGADSAAADEKRKGAEDIAAQARAGADFGELARNSSELAKLWDSVKR